MPIKRPLRKKFLSAFIGVHRRLIAIVLIAAASTAAAQNYPSKPIRVVVPWPPGGGTDLVARTVAQKMHETLSQQAIVDNRAGANGIIGTDLVAKAPADGYTAMITIASHAINATLYAKLPYDTLGDLAPVSLLAEYPFVITVHPSLPVKSIKELIAFAKAHPGKLSYASSGNGSGPHLGMELFKSMAGIDLVHVPYKGIGQGIVDLIGGQIDVLFGSALSCAPYMKSGKLRALAVTSAKRSSLTPEVPTIAESGYPGYEAATWFGIVVAARTPAAITARLNTEINRLLQSADVRERFTALGADPIGGTPGELAAFIAGESAKWRKLIQERNLRAER